MDKVKDNAIKGNKVTKMVSIGSQTEELKALVLSQGLPDDGFWAFASVEVTDIVGDVVKIDGISWDNYHNPPSSYLKITAQHAMELADGTPPVIGRVETFAKTKTVVDGVEVPALAFYMTWAKDKDGNVSELAQKYKDLYDSPQPYMDSFSVGLLAFDMTPNESGGYDYNTSELYHIGAVTVPANPKANVLRGLSEEAEGKIKELTNTVERQSEILCKQAEVIAKVSTDLMDAISKISQSVEQSLKDSSADVQKRFDIVSDRLDFVEAGVVAKSIVPHPTTCDRKRDSKDLSELSSILKKYSGRKD